MIDSFIDYYNKEVSVQGLVADRNSRLQKIVKIFFLLASLACLVFVFVYLWFALFIPLAQRPAGATLVWLSFLFSFVILFTMLLKLTDFFNAQTVKKHLPDCYESGKWSPEKVRNVGMANLVRCIDDKKWDEPQLDKVQALITKKADQSRLNSIIFLTVFVALFIPLWSVYLDKVMDGDGSLEKAFAVFALLVACISILMVHLSDARDNVFTKYMALNKLNDAISELRLTPRSFP